MEGLSITLQTTLLFDGLNWAYPQPAWESMLPLHPISFVWGGGLKGNMFRLTNLSSDDPFGKEASCKGRQFIGAKLSEGSLATPGPSACSCFQYHPVSFWLEEMNLSIGCTKGSLEGVGQSGFGM